MPIDSAHSGTMDWRVARAAEMTRTPMPSVSRIRRCSASTEITDRWRVLSPIAVAGWFRVTSGRNAVRMAAAMLMMAANPYAAPMLHRVTMTGSDEWSDEQPDPKAAAQGGQSAGPERYRDGAR